MKPPDLNQARVNKCLIALVNRKIVRKDNSTVCLLCVHYVLWLIAYRALFYIIGMDYQDNSFDALCLLQ